MENYEMEDILIEKNNTKTENKFLKFSNKKKF